MQPYAEKCQLSAICTPQPMQLRHMTIILAHVCSALLTRQLDSYPIRCNVKQILAWLGSARTWLARTSETSAKSRFGPYILRTYFLVSKPFHLFLFLLSQAQVDNARAALCAEDWLCFAVRVVRRRGEGAAQLPSVRRPMANQHTEHLWPASTRHHGGEPRPLSGLCHRPLSSPAWIQLFSTAIVPPRPLSSSPHSRISNVDIGHRDTKCMHIW